MCSLRVSALAAAAIACAILIPASARAEVVAPDKRGHIAANGLDYYYEIRGRGEPLLLLHGGMGLIEMFGPVLTKLASERQVIAVDLHGHGRTTLGKRHIDPVDMGNDMAVILEKLGHDSVDVLGYSFGGAVAFRLAAQHPARVRRLVLASVGFAQQGFHPELLPMQAAVGAGMAESMKDTPMYRSYVAVAPRPQDFPKLLDEMGAWMRKPFDWSKDVTKLTMPVMLVYGDADMFRLDHVVEFYRLLGGGLKDAGWNREHMSKNRLAILPDLTHYEVFFAPALAATTLPFLNGESGSKSWASQVGARAE